MKIGPKIGPKIMIAGPASKNIPTMNSKILIRKSKINGFSESDNINAARVSGAWLRLTTVLNAIAAPTNNKTTEEIYTPWESNTDVMLRDKCPILCKHNFCK